ncbi:hypothetical protein [Psychroserpens sp. MEBiC05023]
MVKKIRILIILFSFLSCQNKQEKLIGHWHEFKSNESEYLNCYHITDSTIGINPLTNGGYDDYRRGSDIDQSEILSLANDNYNWTSDFKINGNKLIVNDSTFWIKQTDNEQSFLSDFSVGLLVDINPKETDKAEFDFTPNDSIIKSYIFIGTLKNSVWNKNQKFNKEKYYIQLNDKIAQTEDIIPFLLCYHCEMRNHVVLMHMDKNTPIELINEIETEMEKINVQKSSIYYLTKNTTELISGYNHSY